jgi:hypothetical protein
MAVSVVVPEQVASNAYRQMVKPLVGWEFMLVLDIPVGGNWPRACRLWRGSDG